MSQSIDELACTYAALILHDDGIPVTADKLKAIIAAAGIKNVEPFWPALFAKFLEGKNIGDLISNVGAAGAAPAAVAAAAPAAGAAAAPAAKKEEKKEEVKEESDEDMGFGLFD